MPFKRDIPARGGLAQEETFRLEDVMAVGEKHRRGEIALRVLHSLPARHEMVFYRELRKKCMDHVIGRGTPHAEQISATGELLSEVMAKLLVVGASSGTDDDRAQADDGSHGEFSDEQIPETPAFRTNMDVPEEDERILWLLQEVGGRRALDHRLEDMRRRRWGRSQGLGYRFVQISALGNADGDERDEDILAQWEQRDCPQDEPEDPHYDRDVGRAWTGMLAAASQRFKPQEDVRKLLELLAHNPTVQAGFGVEWPVRQIVDALNRIDPIPPWTDDRIENAKRRLRTWIGGIKRDYGLDQTDLLALFARYGRRDASGTGAETRTAGDPRIEFPPAKGCRP